MTQLEPLRAGRPLPVAVRAWLEAVGWGVLGGSAYGGLVLGSLMLLTLPGAITEPSELMGLAAFGVFAAYLAIVWGGLLGGAYGVLAGVPIAIGITALSALNRPAHGVRLRVLGAVIAFTTVALIGVGFVLGLWGNVAGAGYDTTGMNAPSTAIRLTVLALTPGVIAAIIFAWRTPSIARRTATAERPLFASAEDRRAAVARLID